MVQLMTVLISMRFILCGYFLQLSVILILFVVDTISVFFFFFQAEDGIRDRNVTGVQTCALPISPLTVSKEPPVKAPVNVATPLGKVFVPLRLTVPASLIVPPITSRLPAPVISE